MRILVVAAAVIELEWVAGAETLAVGVGPVEAAAGTAARLAHDPPDAVLHVGIAGARSGSGLAIGDVVIGTDSRYVDLRAALPTLITACPPDPGLVARVQAAVPEARALPIATSAAVGGGSGCDVEAMEGFAVLRACARAGVPAVELRAISNMADEPDRAKWDFAAGLEALAEAGRRALAGL
jgi:futalosine hydrolase